MLLGYSKCLSLLLLKLLRVQKTTTCRQPATILSVSFLWLFSTRPFLRSLLFSNTRYRTLLVVCPQSERHVIDEQRDCWSPSIAYYTRHTIHDIIALEHQQYTHSPSTMAQETGAETPLSPEFARSHHAQSDSLVSVPLTDSVLSSPLDESTPRSGGLDHDEVCVTPSTSQQALTQA